MAEMSLGGEYSKGRNMLLPILLALLLLAAGGAWFAHLYLHPAVTGSVQRVELFPVHTAYKRQAGMVGEDQAEDALYVIEEVSLTDKSEVPLFLSSIHGSLTMEDGTVMQADAMQEADLPRLMAMFPKLKAVANAAGPAPLLRESSVAPGTTGSGYVVFSYNVPQSVWDKRSAANVTIDFYHHDPITLAVSK